MTFAILATGPSMSQALVDSLAGLRLVAVNDACRLAPAAEAIVANDRRWWQAHPEALRLPGRKFSAHPPPGVERVEITQHIQTGTNSALLALHVAVRVLGGKRVLLYGLDLSAERGAHFFGPHPAPMPNTTPDRFNVFRAQFAAYKPTLPKGVEVLNATPGSALQCFPFAS
jgi:hypothetical protein